MPTPTVSDLFIPDDRLSAAILSDRIYHHTDASAQPLPGWHPIAGLELYDPRTGYMGQAWGKSGANSDTPEEIMLVSRGTVPGSADGDKTIAADAAFIVGQEPVYLGSAMELYHKIRRSYPETKIIAAGHSLGGATSIAIAAYAEKEGDHHVSAITFNALPYVNAGISASINVPELEKRVQNYYTHGECLTQNPALASALHMTGGTPLGQTVFLTGDADDPAYGLHVLHYHESLTAVAEVFSNSFSESSPELKAAQACVQSCCPAAVLRPRREHTEQAHPLSFVEQVEGLVSSECHYWKDEFDHSAMGTSLRGAIKTLREKGVHIKEELHAGLEHMRHDAHQLNALAHTEAHKLSAFFHAGAHMLQDAVSHTNATSQSAARYH